MTSEKLRRPVRGVAACLALAIVTLIAGCGKPSKPAPEGLAPVSGVVMLDNQPLAGASIMLIPLTQAGSGSQAIDAGAVTDDSGAFELHAGEGESPGAAPGQYRVVISRLVMPDGNVAKPSSDKSPIQWMLDGAKETVHANYSDLAFSKLTATVPPGGGKLEFKLSSTGA